MYNSLILYDTKVADMTKVEYQTQINAPVQRVYEYYTNPNNIQEAWPHDIVKESEDLSDSKNEEGSEMRVKGQYMGKEEEMRLQVVDKEQNKRLVTKQTQGPFKSWESIQEFQGNGTNTTHIKHTVDYELPTSGKIANTLSGSQADNKIRQALEQAAQTVKQKLESGTR
jgi:ligand-binding SRPBCC domain-containing protein